MPINARYQAVFTNGSYYHIFNRSVRGLNLFSNYGNYVFFMQKFSEYLSGVADVYAWCLIPNHFHFLIRVKEYEDCVFTEKERSALLDSSSDVHGVLVKRFKNFFLSYSHSYKRQQNIKTNVFAQRFKRSEVDKDNYFGRVIQYIHLNPLHHKITSNWQDYQWSSYRRIVANTNSLLKVKEVVDWFGGIEAFKKYHDMQESDYLFDESLDD